MRSTHDGGAQHSGGNSQLVLSVAVRHAPVAERNHDWQHLLARLELLEVAREGVAGDAFLSAGTEAEEVAAVAELMSRGTRIAHGSPRTSTTA